jgi:adenylosuccinate synthase
MPYHIAFDGLEEEALGGKAIGTTRKGIGPAFADKTARYGVRAGDLLDKEVLRDRLRLALEYKNKILTKVYGKEPLSFDEIYVQYCAYADRWEPITYSSRGLPGSRNISYTSDPCPRCFQGLPDQGGRRTNAHRTQQ